MMDVLSSLLVPSQEKLADTYDSLSGSSQPQPKRRKVSPTDNMAVTQDLVLPDRTMPLALPSITQQIVDTENSKPPLTTPITGGFLDLQDIEDFDRLHPYTPKAKSRSPQKSPPQSGPPSLVPITSNKASSDSVIKLHDLCQRRGLDHYYEFSGEALTGGFSAQVWFGSQTVQTEGLFPNKKLAKAAAAKLAVAVFSPAENVAGVKRKTIDIDVGPEADKSENWVGLLVEYSQKNKYEYPEYEDFTTDTAPYLFASTVLLPGTRVTKFASTAGPFKSKADAKAAVAKEAVLWLRARGRIPPSLPKRLNPDVVHPSNAASPISPLQNTDAPIDTTSTEGMSPAQRLHHLVASLGFHQPRFDCQRAQAKDGEASAGVPLYDAAIYFDARAVQLEPRLAGPIGKVERVLGQKKAKTACCERALPLLEQVLHEMIGLGG